MNLGCDYRPTAAYFEGLQQRCEDEGSDMSAVAADLRLSAFDTPTAHQKRAQGLLEPALAKCENGFVDPFVALVQGVVVKATARAQKKSSPVGDFPVNLQALLAKYTK